MNRNVTRDEKFPQVLIIGNLERVVLANSEFKDREPLLPPGKGRLSVEVTMEVGIEEDSLKSYFIALAIAIKGITEGGESQDGENEARFFASCKMIGYYVIPDPSGVNEDIINQAAQTRGKLQIYPLVRSHLLLLSRASGIRFNIPPELEENASGKTGLSKASRASRKRASKKSGKPEKSR